MKWPKPKIKKLMALLDSAHPNASCGLEYRDPFQLIVATILSAQCTDERVNKITPSLFEKYPSATALANADIAELELIIRPTGFFRNKARNLIGMASALVKQHDGKVPNVFDSLQTLPGVGQKTANVVLANAFGIPALAVDTHIYRVSRRLGLSEATTPEKVETDLCNHFPKVAWITIHHQLIWHGRLVCMARKPNCKECSLASVCTTSSGAKKDPHNK
ncbi:MAG: endonuclease III [Holophagaceae bacterium]|nr:endonuclease III [Holophagaceae bacterium]